MGGYKITDIIFIKLNAEHMPYMLGIIVEGPNGGKYILDEFCTERAVYKCVDNSMAALMPFNYRISTLLRQYARDKKINIIVFNERIGLATIKTEYGLSGVLYRKSGLESAKRIGKNLLDLKEYVWSCNRA